MVETSSSESESESDEEESLDDLVVLLDAGVAIIEAEANAAAFSSAYFVQ